MDRTISHVPQLTLEVLYVVRFRKKKLFLLELLLGFVWCVVLFGGGTLLLKCSGFIQRVWCTSAKWKLQRGMFKKTQTTTKKHPKNQNKPPKTPPNTTKPRHFNLEISTFFFKCSYYFWIAVWGFLVCVGFFVVWGIFCFESLVYSS